MKLDQEFLKTYGWTEFFETPYLSFISQPENQKKAFSPARVIGENRGLFKILSNADKPVWAEITGNLRHEAQSRLELPAVGDWVATTWQESQKRGLIHTVLPRKTCLKRKEAGTGVDFQVLATNVDAALIMTSANGDLNTRRLERYITLVNDSGVVPVVVLTKAELCDNLDAVILKLKSELINVKVIAISVATEFGLKALDDILKPQNTVVMLGSSGVGKSTLANRLLGTNEIRTREVRDYDDRGKHTTTGRHILKLATEAILIDTPGMRELLLGDSEEGLSQTFHDIEALFVKCKFGNCGHDSEPGCAVKEAIKSGSVDQKRWLSYLKLQNEMQSKVKKKPRK